MADLTAFLDITAANELDVFAHQPGFAERYGPGLLVLMRRCRAHLSAPAWQACEAALLALHPGP